MKAVIHIKGIVGQDVSLMDVIRQYKSFKNVSEVEVHIDSEGGYVEEGMDIYNYLRKLDKPITTKAVKAYSIAASIFMSGDIRLVEEGSQRIMIHMPWGVVKGNSENFETAAKELKKVENNFIEFYSTYTEIDKDTIKRLLQNETFMAADEAVQTGLATGIYSTMKAVAYYSNKTNKKDETIMTRVEKLIKSLAVYVATGEAEILALELQDANGDTVVFPELSENESPEVGSKIEMDGKPANGEIIMPDGSKVIAEEGVIKEIIEAPSEEEEAEDESNEGEEVEEAEASKEDKEKEQAKMEEMLGQFKAAITDEIKGEYEEKFTALNAEIKGLKKEMGASIENDPSEPSSKKKSNERYSISQALNKRSK